MAPAGITQGETTVGDDGRISSSVYSDGNMVSWNHQAQLYVITTCGQGEYKRRARRQSSEKRHSEEKQARQQTGFFFWSTWALTWIISYEFQAGFGIWILGCSKGTGRAWTRQEPFWSRCRASWCPERPRRICCWTRWFFLRKVESHPITHRWSPV